MTTEIEPGFATTARGEEQNRLPAYTLPLLTTWCLQAALVLQLMGLLAPALLLPGIVLAAIGLGAYACVRSGRIENGWAALGLVPFAGLLLVYAVLRRRQPLSNAPFNALRGATHTVLLGLVLVAAGGLMFEWTHRGSEIRGEVPDYFPILAVVPDGSSFSAHIVPKRSFEAFLDEHPDISFLVPEELEAILQANLHDGSNGLFRPGYFKVEQISEHRQAFEVRYPIHDEAYSIGWYEATAQGIEPKRYLSFHDMMIGFLGMPVLLFGWVSYSLLARLLDFAVWPRFRGL